MRPPLEFTTHQIYGYESTGELREMGIDFPGIYVLHFDNGAKYVGRSDDLAGRISTHLREWEQRIVLVDVAKLPYLQTALHEVLTIFEHQAAGEHLMNDLHNKSVPTRPDGAPVRDVEAVDGIRWALLASEDEVSQRPLRTRRPTGAPARPATARMLSSPAAAEVLQVLNAYVTQVLR